MISTYYVLPATVLFFIVLVLSIRPAQKYRLISRWMISLVLLATIASNVMNLPGRFDELKNYDPGMRGRVEHSRYLLDAIRNLKDMPESKIKNPAPFDYQPSFRSTMFLLNPLEMNENSIRSFIYSSVFFNWLLYRKVSSSGR